MRFAMIVVFILMFFVLLLGGGSIALAYALRSLCQPHLSLDAAMIVATLWVGGGVLLLGRMFSVLQSQQLMGQLAEDDEDDDAA